MAVKSVIRMQSLIWFRPASLVRMKSSSAIKKLEDLIRHRDQDFVLTEAHKRHLEPLISEEGRLQNHWQSLFIANPGLLSKHGSSLLKLDATLESLGSSKRKRQEILESFDAETLSDLTYILTNLQNWKSFCDKRKIDWIKALIGEPRVLLMEANSWEDRRQDLRQILPNASIAPVLEHCPSVFLQSWDELEIKLNFLLTTMNVRASDIAKSRALDQDLDFIQERYEFLRRCGLYKHPNPKAVGIVAKAEPDIGLVLLPGVEEFLELTTSGTMTQEEYNTFATIFMTEKEKDGQVNFQGIDDPAQEELERESLEHKANFK